jgi:nucleotide-binding universal stress UspA family protein
MRFETLLFHTRFRELAFNSLKRIIELKAVGLKKVVLAHVIPREDVAFVPYGGTLKDDLKRFQEQARLKFDDWVQTIGDPQLTFNQRVEVGTTNAKILEMAETEDVDLIVVGRKKRTTFEKVYVGTHILDILRRSAVPVLMSKYMVQYEWQGEPLMRTNDKIWKRPLLASDWSEPSQRGLDATIALKGLAEKIIVTHVIGARRIKNVDANGVKRLEDESTARLKAYCKKIDDAGIESEYHLAIGRTVEEIIKISRDYGATMIVMGRTGKDWFQEYWLGGVSHRVAELSELPVLLIP